ncbi:hypothetical protein Trydic_g21534 [Trypoxylus dichotomus]
MDTLNASSSNELFCGGHAIGPRRAPGGSRRAAPYTYTVEGQTLEEIEAKLEDTLDIMANYYQNSSLKPNLSKTQVSAFLLDIYKAHKKLKVAWEDNELEHVEAPKYMALP